MTPPRPSLIRSLALAFGALVVLAMPAAASNATPADSLPRLEAAGQAVGPTGASQAEEARRICTFETCGPRRADSPWTVAAFGAVAVCGGLFSRRRAGASS